MTRLRQTVRSLAKLREHIDVEKAAENIRGNIYFRGPNVYILFCAIIIASLGLNVNSIPVIIGAMLVSPLMGPIVGFGLALGTNDSELLRASLRHLLVMVCISIAASTLYFLLTPLRLENPSELLARTNPTIYDVLIAFFGGLAGILETSRREKGTVLAGVAIATALMPPLCTIGYGIAQLNLSYALGALYLFSINGIFIALATFLGVKYLRFPVKTYRDPARQKRIHRSIVIILIIIIIPSVFSALSIIRENNFDRSVDTLMSNIRRVDGPYVYDYRVDHTSRPPHLELMVAGRTLDASGKETLYALAEEQGIVRSQLTINTHAIGGAAYSEELLSDALSRHSRQQADQDSLIARLQRRIAAYESQELPSAQLASEIRTQYPQVGDITLAQGSTIGADGGKSATAKKADAKTPRQVVVVVENGLEAEEAARLEKWLSVRLEGRPVRVILGGTKE